MSVEQGVLIIALVEMFKKVGISSKFLPVIAVLLGGLLAVAPVIYADYYTILTEAVKGLTTGLVATGLISVADGRLENINSANNDRAPHTTEA